MESGVVSCEEENWRGLEEQRQHLESYLSRRCADMNDVDDVVQETMIRAARFRKKLDQPERLRAWLASIAGNVLLDRKRRNSRFIRQAADDYMLESVPATEPEEQMFGTEPDLRWGNWLLNREKVLACLSGELRKLESGDRDLLLSFYGRERGGCREVASEYGLTPNIVKMRLFRARHRLLRAVSRRFALINQLPTPKPC